MRVPAGASAIVGGQPDGNTHPNVGVVALDGDLACSGTLVAPQLVLTAGHCMAGVTQAQVSFDEIAPPPPDEPGSEGRYITGTPHAHPAFGMRNGHGYNDVGVVVLDDPASSVAGHPARPAAGRQRTVIGLTNGGSSACTGFSNYQRTDSPGARGLLDDFMALP